MTKTCGQLRLAKNWPDDRRWENLDQHINGTFFTIKNCLIVNASGLFLKMKFHTSFSKK